MFFTSLLISACLLYTVPQIKTASDEIDAVVYGYSSTIDQTDLSPFRTASGQMVRDGIAANNCLPFGVKVVINDRIYEVQDRMSSRYNCNVFDIWFSDRQTAIEFGKQRLKIRIIKR